MLARCFVAACALSMIAGAQTPAGWKPYQEGGACQILLPPEWRQGSVPGIYGNPARNANAILVIEASAKPGPLPDLAIKAFDPATVVENSAKRVFLQGKPQTIGGKSRTAWNIWVPIRSGGACHLTLSLQPAADANQVRQIADTVRALK